MRHSRIFPEAGIQQIPHPRHSRFFPEAGIQQIKFPRVIPAFFQRREYSKLNSPVSFPRKRESIQSRGKNGIPARPEAQRKVNVRMDSRFRGNDGGGNDGGGNDGGGGMTGVGLSGRGRPLFFGVTPLERCNEAQLSPSNEAQLSPSPGCSP